MTTSTPMHTLYIKNLNDQISHEQMRQVLYSLFTQYGRVLDIVTCKARRLRGQGWIVYDEIPSATNALRHLQGQSVYNKPMEIDYAKTKSDAIAKRDGTFVPREKRKRSDSKEANAPAPTPTPSAEPLRSRVIRNEPHHILFLDQLPASCTEQMLEILFKQYHGFQELRIVPNKQMGFVEFQDTLQAQVALESLDGFQLSTNDRLRVNFAKK